MTALTDFLLARIAEDEAVARRVPNERMVLRASSAGAEAQILAHLTRHSPARVLAECEAKRRIVEWATYGGTSSPRDGEDDHYYLRLLALPYADHPEFDERWRP